MTPRMLHQSKCPSCKEEGSLRNSRPRNTGERVFRTITWFELFRCKKCGWRGWKANLILDRELVVKILFYLLLMILTSFIVYNLLKLVV